MDPWQTLLRHLVHGCATNEIRDKENPEVVIEPTPKKKTCTPSDVKLDMTPEEYDRYLKNELNLENLEKVIEFKFI